MKECTTCGAEKPLTEYYRHKTGKDGHFGQCKECKKARVSANRQANAEKYRAYDRARGNRHTKEYYKQYAQANKHKLRAHQLVRRYLTSPGACQECSSTYWVEAHHDNYRQPLSVRWLCSACHHQLHAKAAVF